MTDLLHVLAPTPPNKDGKSFLNRIGTAFATKTGGWSITLNSLPLPVLNDKGQLETRMLLMPPKSDSGYGQASGGAPAGGDDIPFAPEWRG